jgi:hypothetical protein
LHLTVSFGVHFTLSPLFHFGVSLLIFDNAAVSFHFHFTIPFLVMCGLILGRYTLLMKIAKLAIVYVEFRSHLGHCLLPR